MFSKIYCRNFGTYANVDNFHADILLIAQTCEESAKMIGCLNNGLVTRNVSHGAKSVEDLRTADTRNAVHGEDIHLLLSDGIHQLLVLRRVDETDEVPPFPQEGHLLQEGCPHFQNDVRFIRLLFRYNIGPSFGVGVIIELWEHARAVLNVEGEPLLFRKHRDRGRHDGHSPLILEDLLGNADGQVFVGDSGDLLGCLFCLLEDPGGVLQPARTLQRGSVYPGPHVVHQQERPLDARHDVCSLGPSTTEKRVRKQLDKGFNFRRDIWSYISLHGHLYTGVQLATTDIAKGYKKLCLAIIIFALVARLAIRKVKF